MLEGEGVYSAGLNICVGGRRYIYCITGLNIGGEDVYNAGLNVLYVLEVESVY